jgi:hypothetical protein
LIENAAMTIPAAPSSQIRQAFLHVFFLQEAKRTNPRFERQSEAVRRDLLASLQPLVLIALISGLLLWAVAKIGPEFSVHWGRLASSCGAFLAGWATWFGLAERNASYGGTRPDELARSCIFKALMWPGIALSVIGAAWWP